MRRTVVGIFDRPEAARAAIAALARSGFAHDHIHVGAARAHATAAVVAAPQPTGGGLLGALGRFLAETYGDPAPAADSDAPGSAVVQVDVDDRALAPQAELALVSAGAVDITHQSLP
jgi:hypothetical protein